MTPRARRSPAFPAVIAAGLLLGSAPLSQAQTICDTDPNAVPFEATVDPTALNNFLARLGSIDVPSTDPALTLGGLCVDHQIPVELDIVALPVGEAPFTVTPSLGSLEVGLDIPGPFNVGIDGGGYRAVNCDSTCVIDVPYIGEIFNGCSIEEALARPVFSLFNVSASWDDIRVTQTADTCVLGDCTAVHPVQSTQATLFGFDIDATGFGECEVCLDFPEPFDFLDACLNPCDGIDGLLTDLIQPELEGAIEGAFVNRQGEGTLIKVFSRQITRDGCAQIPEVRECLENQPVVQVGFIRSPNDRRMNGLLYSLPFVVAVGLTLRLRRRA